MQRTRETHESRIILDLCGGTGAWSAPYKAAGYDVRVITLPQYDVRQYVPPPGVHGILAAPPCTHFSLARTAAKTPRNLTQALEIVQACLQVIWTAELAGGLAFWALENPVGLLRKFLGQPPLTFDPLDYGDEYTKRTDLWGRFNPPARRPVSLTPEQVHRMQINNRVLPALPVDYKLPPGERPQAARRAITPPHFAQAFFRANR